MEIHLAMAFIIIIKIDVSASCSHLRSLKSAF